MERVWPGVGPKLMAVAIMISAFGCVNGLILMGARLYYAMARDRLFFRAAVWLHATRGKQAWKYISDVYALLLLYLAISGLFMIKGRLGLKWRGTVLVGVGLAAPVLYIVLSGGPGAPKADPKLAKQTDGSGIRLLTPDENK